MGEHNKLYNTNNTDYHEYPKTQQHLSKVTVHTKTRQSEAAVPMTDLAQLAFVARLKQLSRDAASFEFVQTLAPTVN